MYVHRMTPVTANWLLVLLLLAGTTTVCLSQGLAIDINGLNSGRDAEKGDQGGAGAFVLKQFKNYFNRATTAGTGVCPTFACASGAKPRQNPSYDMTPNGCGTETISVSATCE
jgi:hypothetical protein